MATELPYATLRDLYSGKSSNPGIQTLERIATRYCFYTGWFTDSNVSDEVPLGGALAFMEPTVRPDGSLLWKHFDIPWVSWPLPYIYLRFLNYLLALPAAVNRPIIGDLGESDGDEYRIQARIGRYLLAPYDAAEAAGLFRKDFGADWTFHDADLHRVQSLRRLGVYWEIALGPLLSAMPPVELGRVAGAAKLP